MRFSGHETFAIREGWLYKGVAALQEAPGFFNEKYPADRLGVGSNMGKSIKHWLLASGLAQREGGEGRKRGQEVVLSDFGRLVLNQDPFFNYRATWAFVHVNLAVSEESTACWNWFLNACAENVFTRGDVLEQFRRWSKYRAPKEPSPTTLQKDLNCFLVSYAQKVPADRADAEEATDCPLWELDLVTYYRGSQRFRANRNAKALPSQVIGYSLALAAGEPERKRSVDEISFEDAVSLEGGPGRVFLMGPSALYECVERMVRLEPNCRLAIGAQAGLRTIKYPNLEPLEWAKEFYARRKGAYANEA
jgi:hypothetical protein